MYKFTENGVLKSLETWKLIIPLHDNSGKPFSKVEIDSIVEGITLKFPGITMVNCVGIWTDSKQTFRDENIQIIVDALSADHSQSAAFFSELKDELRKRLCQEKIYITQEASKQEFISFDEFLSELGVEYDPNASTAEKKSLAQKFSQNLETVMRRLGYETLVLRRDFAGKKIIWERRFCGLTLRSVLDDPFPQDVQVVAADRIDQVQKAFGSSGFAVIGHYEFQAFAVERMPHRPFVSARTSGLNFDPNIKYFSPSREPLSLDRFIEEFTMSIVTNYAVLREEGFLCAEIKMSVGSDGSLQVGEASIGTQVMFCPAAIPDKDIQLEIIRCVAEACNFYETGSLDPIAVIQAKAKNRYILKRAAIRRFLKPRS